MKILYSIIFIFVFTFSSLGQTNTELSLGNPSKAKTDKRKSDNYLLEHNSFAFSYNKSRGTANWVAWHLAKSDVGTVDRSNAFAPDTKLPQDWWIKPTDYTGSGYDRSHLCPSKDRSSTDEANRETFLMSNMQPQTPKLNQKTWKYLEDYERELTRQGNEGYIFAGCYGDKGKILDKITIPTQCWKIIVVLAEGENDLKRIDKTTRVIAVNMPNDETVSQRWRTYLTTVDDIEQKTGYDFLAKVPKKVQKIIESVKDNSSETDSAETDANEAIPSPATIKAPTDKKAGSTTAKGKKNSSGDRVYQLGSRGGCYYETASGKKSYVDKKFCENVVPAAGTKEGEEVKPVPTQANEKPSEKPTGKSSNSDGRTYIKGSRGGCYYLSESGKKVYVKDKSLCQ